MPRILSARLSETWLKAAIVGSLWASLEIVIGAFLHNMRIPFAGTMLAFASVGLVIAFLQVWSVRGLVWKAGLIAALLKSLSPSAIILGPMIGIFSEAIIIELLLLLTGRNLLGYMLAGAFAVLSALIQLIISLLIKYGFDLVIIVDQLFKYIIKQLGMTTGNPLLLLILLICAYLVLGMSGAVIGYLAGRMALGYKGHPSGTISANRKGSFFQQDSELRSAPWLLIFHLFCIVACLYMLNTRPFQLAFIPSVIYAGYCFYMYRGSMRAFRKPSFWIWFMGITVLAAVFWNGLSTGKIWDIEGLLVGLKMNLRAIVILTGFAAISKELRNPVIRTVLYHHGFASVYHSAGLAFSVLPAIIDVLPGVRTLFSKPVSSLGWIVRQAADVYPALEKEISEQNPVIIITGEVQEGKTAFLIELLEFLKVKNIRIKGFIARGVHIESKRTGYDLEDISNGKTYLYIRTQAPENWFRHGKYYFNPETENTGKQILRDIEKDQTDLVVIDEIGPVELKGFGWAAEVERMLKTTRLIQLWVVRKPLLKKVIRHWKVGDVMVLDIKEDRVEIATDEVVNFIRERQK